MTTPRRSSLLPPSNKLILDYKALAKRVEELENQLQKKMEKLKTYMVLTQINPSTVALVDDYLGSVVIVALALLSLCYFARYWYFIIPL